MRARPGDPLLLLARGLLLPFLLGLSLLVSLGGCASVEPRPRFVPPAPIPPAETTASGASIGLVLTGGGAFGAWEIGALQAFFDSWIERYGEEPPIRVVAGTSTGALLAPFAFLGREGLVEASEWYAGVEQGDLLSVRLATLLPFPLFAALAPSPYTVGHPGSRKRRGSRLYRILHETLDAADLGRIAAAWPERRIGVTSLDFATGRPRLITNGPSEVARFRDGMLASAAVPLMLPPVNLPGKRHVAEQEDDRLPARHPQRGEPAEPPPPGSPHMDGGIYAIAPFAALFELAAIEPAIPLTHVVLVSAFPEFPGGEVGSVQEGDFPMKPDFREIGDRMATLLAEAGVAKDLALVRAAIALRRAGEDGESVRSATGLFIPGEAPELIELLPTGRLGWKALEFRRDDMREMFERGYHEGRAILERSTPRLTPVPSPG